MTERIINQPEIIKPEFYLEKIGEGGIEFVEQFLKTPGTLAHSLNYHSDKEQVSPNIFLEMILKNDKVCYKPVFYKDERALSLYFTYLDNKNAIISNNAKFGIRSPVWNISEGFIIFNNKLSERMKGENYIDDEILTQLIKYEKDAIFSIASELFKIDPQLLKYFGLLRILKIMKGLRQLVRYANKQISKTEIKEELINPHLKYDLGIRMIGFDDDGVLKPLPIRREEIAYVGLTVEKGQQWKVCQMKQKSR